MRPRGKEASWVRRIGQMTEEITTLRAALEKAHLALHSEGTTAAFQIAAIHGFRYTGPTFTEDDYRKAIKPSAGGAG